ncbi:MAG: endonuclease/exonuclease/phosphatase family protein [Psittacicella sp.]
MIKKISFNNKNLSDLLITKPKNLILEKVAHTIYNYDYINIFPKPQIKTYKIDINLYNESFDHINKNYKYELKNNQLFKYRSSKKIFKLISWNMHKGMDPNWRTTLYNLSKESDFILLQEVFENNKLQTFQFLSEFKIIHTGSFEKKGFLSGIMSLSRYNPTTFYINSQVEPWILVPKMGMILKYNINNQNILIVNLHLINFEMKLVRFKKQLEDIFNILTNSKDPIIIVGDLNSWNGFRLKLLDSYLKRENLIRVSFNPDNRSTFLNKPLDHIYAKGIRIINSKSYKVNSSDHNPLEISFEII